MLKLSTAKRESIDSLVREVHIFINRPATKSSHVFYAIAYLNRVAGLVGGKDEKVRLMLFKIYFSMFRKILENKEKPGKPEKGKKDRTKSKDNQDKNKESARAELKETDNKVAELVLKGVNILMTKSSDSLDLMSPHNSELKKMIEDETNVLFMLTHHSAFKI